MKKKKRVDPAIEQNRQRRKIRRIEKEIKRLSRIDRVLVPVEEIEGDRQLLKNLSYVLCNIFYTCIINYEKNFSNIMKNY